MNDDALYPKSPAEVPADFTQPSKAYRRHAWLAVTCVVAFFMLYLGATGWFGYKAYALGRAAWSAGSPQGWLGAALASFFCVVLAKALLPSRRPPAPDRIEITAEEEPLLFAFVHRIADEAQAPRPHKVFVAPDVNAAVFYEPSLVNLLVPSQKNLLIGLGLVNVLSLSEFKAVLAHEFGHFAQRAMAVGRWVYVAQQVAGRIIARRDVVDRLLLGVSYVDIRIAWIGWILRLLVWAIRALTETFFRLVIIAERALSREMELQADRVSVSLAGSDALVHGLFRLRSADAAWDQAVAAARTQLGEGRRVPDLYALQSQALVEMRRIFGDDTFGDVPPIPEDASAHRIFNPSLAQPPVMWSTHPASHVRERHAKAVYVEAEEDARSSWALFADPQRMRERSTVRELQTWGGPLETTLLSADDALRFASERYDVGSLERRYRGLYLGRRVTRSASTAAELVRSEPLDQGAAVSVLRDPYPAEVSEMVQARRELADELVQLKALEAGIAAAPGGVIQHRGRTVRRRQLPVVVASVEAELAKALAALGAVDQRIRTAHQWAAESLGGDWGGHHRALLALLHFAEHLEANLDDSMGHLFNVWDVVSADGRITGGETTRLLNSAVDVYGALLRVWESRTQVSISPAVAAFMEVASWSAAFEEDFGLHPPSRENIENWLSVVESWFHAYSGMMARLRDSALEVVLDTEGHIRRCWAEGRDPGPVPESPRVGMTYPPFAEGAERKLQTKLGFWDRFVTADGWAPGAVRLAVAGGIVGFATFSGVSVVSGEIVVHNGLYRPVQVFVGDSEATLPALGRHVFSFDDDAAVQIEARTVEGELIEQFSSPIENPLGTYVYSVAGAAPLVSWTALYGGGRATDQRRLGGVRWLESEADYVFTDPPRSVTSSGRGEQRTVLSAVDASDSSSLVIAVGSLPPSDLYSVAMTHGRWDSPVLASLWLLVAHSQPTQDEDVHALLERRLADEPGNVALGRVRQVFAEAHGERDAVCAEDRATAQARPADPDAAYLSLRCLPDSLENARAVLAVAKNHPSHAWLQKLAGFAHYQLADYEAALEAWAHVRRLDRMHAEQGAVVEARVRRLIAEMEGAVYLDDLEEDSLELRFLVGRERESRVSEQTRAYRLLERGAYDAAVRVGTEDGERARVVRLIAASDEATDKAIALAVELDVSPNMGVAEIVASIVATQRAGGDLSALAEILRGTVGSDYAEVLLAFADPVRLAKEHDALEARRLLLPPEYRGHAAVLGIATVGLNAPTQWYTDVRRLLFVGERPRLIPPEEDAAESEAGGPEDAAFSPAAAP